MLLLSRDGGERMKAENDFPINIIYVVCGKSMALAFMLNVDMLEEERSIIKSNE